VKVPFNPICFQRSPSASHGCTPRRLWLLRRARSLHLWERRPNSSLVAEPAGRRHFFIEPFFANFRKEMS
jgi:hypothetical protein